MIKNFCDCCGKEMQEKCEFVYLCHLSNLLDSFNGGFIDDNCNVRKIAGYVDNDGNAVSGRTESVDLCHKCYNMVVGAAVRKLNELRKEKK